MRVRYLDVVTGMSVNISQYPNFDASGSIIGMRKIYGKNAYLLRCGSYIYNVPAKIYYMGH